MRCQPGPKLAALYRAKESGRGEFHHFEADMRVQIDRRRRLERDIRRGLAAEEFTVFYQPILPLDRAGCVSFEALLLFLVIFVWTPPHFWALSLYRTDDYAKAGIPMLPVVAGPAETRRQIVLYSVLLLPTGASPWLLGYAGAVYGAVALVAGMMMVALAWRVHGRTGAPGEQAAKHLFAFSILYLVVLFAALLVEGLGGFAGRMPV